jgi:hypothetical protein
MSEFFLAISIFGGVCDPVTGMLELPGGIGEE